MKILSDGSVNESVLRLPLFVRENALSRFVFTPLPDRFPRHVKSAQMKSNKITLSFRGQSTKMNSLFPGATMYIVLPKLNSSCVIASAQSHFTSSLMRFDISFLIYHLCTDMCYDCVWAVVDAVNEHFQ